jgi:uncharacterized cupredoxin-like copper-binding protein
MLIVVAGLLLVACSPTADRRDIPPGTDRVVELTMSGMRFIPDKVTVKMGQTVTFVVTNPNDIPHELFIGNMADQMAHHAAHMAAPSDAQALVSHMGYGIYLQAHGTGMVTYHFATAGEILLGCHLPGHWEAGMVASVTVTP